MRQAAEKLGQTVGVKRACEALSANRATLYRRRNRQAGKCPVSPRPQPPLRLREQDRQTVLDLMYSERFIDASPHTFYATILDEGHYYCSVRTRYRLLEANCGNGVISGDLRSTPNRSCWLPLPTSCGPGISPSSTGRHNGPSSIGTSSSTSSPAVWWAGWWQHASPLHWPRNSSATPAPNSVSSLGPDLARRSGVDHDLQAGGLPTG